MGNAIFLSDDVETIYAKVKTAVTEPAPSSFKIWATRKCAWLMNTIGFSTGMNMKTFALCAGMPLLAVPLVKAGSLQF
jgi:tryptophanyl-tRNA synthetase